MELINFVRIKIAYDCVSELQTFEFQNECVLFKLLLNCWRGDLKINYLCEIWCCHVSDVADSGLLWCSDVSTGKWLPMLGESQCLRSRDTGQFCNEYQEGIYRKCILSAWWVR